MGAAIGPYPEPDESNQPLPVPSTYITTGTSMEELVKKIPVIMEP
jgi:hypothetical protein